MNSDADLEMILADMRQEFLESCEDRLTEIEAALARMRSKQGNKENDASDLKRHVHSIKGGGGSFGFSSLTLLAHALEDYLETSREIGPDQVFNIQLFIDRMQGIVDSAVNPSDDETASVIRGLPLRGLKKNPRLESPTVVLLLMPKGIQRKIMSRELAAFGFKLVIANGSMEAIDLALVHKPEIVISTMQIDRLTGLELGRVLATLDATKHARMLLMTADGRRSLEGQEIPHSIMVQKKGTNFSETLIRFLTSMEMA